MRPIDADLYESELAKGTIISDDLYEMGIMAGVDYARKKLADVPTLTLDDLRPHGFWVVIHDVDGNFKCCSCSECGEDDDRLTKYCPSCGARMDKRIER